MSKDMSTEALRALDAEVAEKLFGYTWWKWTVATTTMVVKAQFAPGEMDIPRRGGYLPASADDGIRVASHTEKPPRYSSTPEGSALVLAEIAKRKLGEAYTRALMRIMDPRRFDCLSPPEIFALLTASPEQVSRAALEVLATASAPLSPSDTQEES